MENKKMKITSRCHTINRQSFSDRICDDLCEVLLSYLSFEDKIKFESISKQWKSLIFNKQNVLEVYYPRYEVQNEGKDQLNQLINDSKRDSRYEGVVNLKAFESVLKKCQFINQINIRSFNSLDDEHYECVLQLVIKYCNHLKEIKFHLNDISEQTLRQFGEKFGSKLEVINFHNNYKRFHEKYKTLLRFCPNLIEMNRESTYYLSLLIDKNVFLVPKLQKINLYYSNEDIENMKIFTNSLKNTLKTIEFSSFRDLNQKELNSFIQEVIGLKKLEELIFDFLFELNCPQLTAHLKTIGIQCKQLKRFELNLLWDNENLNYEVFNTMSYFKQLKYLKIDFDNYGNLDPNKDILSESLKECRNLTHLRLNYNKINDNFFVNIHLNLPKLKYLAILDMSEVTDKTMHSLAKLTQLETLIMKKGNYEPSSYVTDSGVCDLIQNCPQIKSVSFHTRLNITHKTIEELIKLALNKPNIQFIHNLSDISYEDNVHNDIIFSIIDLNALNLPKNLIIDDFFDVDLV